jgi:hypothetical protein
LLNTTNYNLNKPEATENYSVDHQNQNMEIIDAALAPTADPLEAPSGNGPGKLVQWVGWFANLFKAITGKANWWEAPTKNLEEMNTTVNTHLAETMPHKFTDATDGLTYKYGLKTNTAKDGLIFVYEEVV